MKKFLLLFKFTIIIFFIFISVYFIYNRKLLNSYYQERLIFKTKKLVSIDDGLRGNIYDKNGILLVGNKKVYNLTYHYNENEDILEILKFLYNNFNINKDEFLKKVNNSYKYEDIILKDNLFTRSTHQKKLLNAIRNSEDILKIAKELYLEMKYEKPIRLIGIRVNNLTDMVIHQVSIFESNIEENIKLEKTVNDLKEKYGTKIIKNLNK